MSSETLKAGQRVELIARHTSGKEVAITATAKQVFGRVLHEIQPNDWFVCRVGWTVHARNEESALSVLSGTVAVSQEAGCSV